MANLWSFLLNVFFVGWQVLNLEMKFEFSMSQTKIKNLPELKKKKKSFYLGVEATDLDS